MWSPWKSRLRGNIQKDIFLRIMIIERICDKKIEQEYEQKFCILKNFYAAVLAISGASNK
jgi:hypothetical protein